MPLKSINQLKHYVFKKYWDWSFIYVGITHLFPHNELVHLPYIAVATITKVLSRPRMGDCCDRLVRFVTPFGRTFGIALPAVLISRSGSFVAILPTFPALGWLKRLAARVWLLNAKSVTRWSSRPQQVAGTRWFALRSVLEDVAHVCAYSDGYVQPLVRPGSHPW